MNIRIISLTAALLYPLAGVADALDIRTVIDSVQLTQPPGQIVLYLYSDELSQVPLFVHSYESHQWRSNKDLSQGLPMEAGVLQFDLKLEEIPGHDTDSLWVETEVDGALVGERQLLRAIEAAKIGALGIIESTQGGFRFPDGSLQSTAAYDSGGGTDNLGNHTAIQNIQLGSYYLSGDGDNEGIQVDAEGKVGIAESTGIAELTVGGSNGVVFTGINLQGEIPAEGAGSRMMWYPEKAAFRAGVVNGTQWNKSWIGHSSVATGYNTKAEGYGSVAMGLSNVAGGTGSFAMGEGTAAKGSWSTAIGYNTNAFEYGSMALGFKTNATSRHETAIGIYNTDYTPLDTLHFNPEDRLFVIGNGPDELNRSDALVMLKNGNMGLGTAQPKAKIHIKTGLSAVDSDALHEDEIVIEAQDAVLGLYSTNQGSWGSAITFKEIDQTDNHFIDAWGIARKNDALHFTYGTNKNYASNTAKLIMEADGSLSQPLGAEGMVKAWIKMNADGTIKSCFLCNTFSTHRESQGIYRVHFSMALTDRPHSATLGAPSTGNILGTIVAVDYDLSSIRVYTGRADGQLDDRDFDLVVY